MARNLRNLTQNSLKYLIKNATNVKTLIADSTYGLQITIPDNNSSAFSIRTNPNIFVIDTSTDTIQMTGSVYISGSLYANEYNIDTITTTITNIDQQGSTKFGDTSDDTHQFTGSLYIADDAKIYFGAGQDAKIEYDENNTNKLILSGATGGFDINMADNATSAFEITETGTSYMKFTTTNNQEEIVVNKNLFMRGGDLKVENDFHNAAFEITMDDGSAGSGEILYYEPGADTTLTKGGIYFLHTDGTWDEADADTAATGKALLGIALGTSARDTGVLLRGFVKIPSTEVLNVPGLGASDGLPVYISTTAAHIDFTAPSASGDIVRIVGYCVDDDSSDILLYFCPDKTWVEIA